ncbi:MAG: hypothetical protein ABI346_09195 [Candidatus Baltobacteraceae bacterium]
MSSHFWALDETIHVSGSAYSIAIRGGVAYVGEGPFPHGFVGVYSLPTFTELRTLSLPSPRFTTPGAVTVDAEGTVYVGARPHRGKPGAIAIFAPGQTQPSGYIEGPNTGFSSPSGVRVGP